MNKHTRIRRAPGRAWCGAQAIALALLGAASAQAETTVVLGGHISYLDPTLASPSFKVGDLMTMTVVYDASQMPLPGSVAEAAAYMYDSFSMQFGTFQVSAPPSDPWCYLGQCGLVAVHNNEYGRYDLFSGGAVPLPGSSSLVNGMAASLGSFTLFDYTMTAFDSTALPTSLSLAAFSQALAELQFCPPPFGSGSGGCGGPSVVDASVDTLSVVTTAVPEPATAPLVACGFAALLFAARRRIHGPHRRKAPPNPAP